MSVETKLEQIQKHFISLKEALSQSMDSVQGFADLSKEYAQLLPLMETYEDLKETKKSYASLLAVDEEETQTPEMHELIEAELSELTLRIQALEGHLNVLLLPKDEDDESNVILEIRAGTGGDEASLFAADLFRMYKRYADIQGWRFETMHMSDTGLGGIKEASAHITGHMVYAQLKFESGVHRVQRVPATEGSGRIHTSAATVAVLPEPKDVDIVIEEKDLRIDVFRSSGPGGQSVNTTDSAVRITHLPTGITVSQQDEKSQHKNKAKGLKILRARLYDAERTKRDAERAQQRKTQIGSGDRSERIRTYNFPQGRVTDHRINLTLYKLAQILEGSDLHEVIEQLQTEDQSAQLAALASDS